MSPELSGLLAALEHVERRRILTALTTTESVEIPVDIEIPGSAAVAAEIRLDILHYHLPELAKHKYVTFDEDDHLVTRGPRFAEIRPFLGRVNGHGHSDDSA